MAHKINVYGTIGSDWSGITAKQLVGELAKAAESDDPDIDLHINSGGGYVDDAVAMVNRLRKHAKDTGAEITVYIDGLAASAATLVMLAASPGRRFMPSNASAMIHQPWGMAIGTSEDMRKSADLLEMTEGSMVAMYAAATGLDAAEIREMLAAETWLDAESAKEFGFVDVVLEADDEAEAMACYAAKAYAAAASTSGKLAAYTNAPIWAVENNSKPAPATRAAASVKTAASSPQTATAEPTANTENEQMDETTKTANAPVEASSTATPDNGQAIKAERARVRGIVAAAKQFGLGDDFTDPLIDNGRSVIEAKAAIADHMAAKQASEGMTGGTIRVEVDEADNRIQAVERAIMARAGLLSRAEAAAERANPWLSLSAASVPASVPNSSKSAAFWRRQTARRIITARTAGRPPTSGSLTRSATSPTFWPTLRISRCCSVGIRRRKRTFLGPTAAFCPISARRRAPASTLRRRCSKSKRAPNTRAVRSTIAGSRSSLPRMAGRSVFRARR